MPSHEGILIVDDERGIRTVIAQVLEKNGYHASATSSPAEALRACKNDEYSLALVDLKMPGAMDGIGLLGEFARDYPDMVVILMTGYGTLESAVSALRIGAFDYLTKPVDMPKLLEAVERGLAKWREGLRQKRLLNTLHLAVTELKGSKDQPGGSAEVVRSNGRSNAGSVQSDRIIKASDLILDRQKRLVLQKEKPLELSTSEFEFLEYLISHAERYVSASELVKAVRGEAVEEIDARPMVRVQIQRLRHKLKDDSEQPRYIMNIRGKGYRFIAD